MTPIRIIIFRPYQHRIIYGLTFTLSIIDFKYHDDKNCIHYRLRMKPWLGKSVILFEGSDYKCSSLHSVSSDKTVIDLMNLLTLRPDGANQEYFNNYTRDQLNFCDQYAEDLSIEVMNRFVSPLLLRRRNKPRSNRHDNSKDNWKRIRNK